MALRFRRSMKIAPGVKLNLTNKGVSARIGPRGAGLTVGRTGTTVSAGLPGTGLHVSEKFPAGSDQKTTNNEAPLPDKRLGIFGRIVMILSVLALLWAVSALFA